MKKDIALDGYFTGNLETRPILEYEILGAFTNEELKTFGIVGAQVVDVRKTNNGVMFLLKSNDDFIVYDSGNFFRVLDDEKVLRARTMILSEVLKIFPEVIIENDEHFLELIQDLLGVAEKADNRKTYTLDDATPPKIKKASTD